MPVDEPGLAAPVHTAFLPWTDSKSLPHTAEQALGRGCPRIADAVEEGRFSRPRPPPSEPAGLPTATTGLVGASGRGLCWGLQAGLRPEWVQPGARLGQRPRGQPHNLTQRPGEPDPPFPSACSHRTPVPVSSPRGLWV